MSRPFSYNDENFTVIGNMLFIHICNKYMVFPGKQIAKVPLAIRDRVYHYENYLIMTNTNSVSDNALVPVTLQYGYLTTRNGFPDIPELEKGERWYYGMYLLKDI
jgi:hypothetical protein